MDVKELKNIVKMVEQANISTLKLESDGVKIEVRKELSPAPVVTAAAPALQPVVTQVVTEPAAAPVTPATDANLVAITSPMVGTFYSSPGPDKPTFVKPGDKISAGNVVCIIEAMKLFNEIESELSGTIEKVLVDNGAAVEYGQELFLIRKN